MQGKLMMSRRLVVTCSILFWISSVASTEIPQAIIVYGRVFLPDSRPAVQLRVNITGQNGFNASTNTDGRGSFRFEVPARSIFSLTVNLPRDSRYHVEPISVDATIEGNSFMADIFLRNPLESSLKKEKAGPVISSKEAVQQIPKDARKALNKAQKYREQKKSEAALAELDKAIQIFPEYFQAFAEKGVVLINSNRLQEALQDFSKALEIFPEYEPALSGAGYCLLTLGNYKQSVALLERAVHLDSTHAKNLLFLGIANLALSRWQKAQEVLQQAVKLDPAGTGMARVYLADALAGQHLYGRAADDLNTYLQLNPASPNADRLRKREQSLRSQK